MGRRYVVVLKVRDADWAAFHEVLDRRQTTVDSAYAWLKKRGYNDISRSAVYGYMHAIAAMRERPQATPESRNAVKTMIIYHATRMGFEDLQTLARFAAFLASPRGHSKRG